MTTIATASWTTGAAGTSSTATTTRPTSTATGLTSQGIAGARGNNGFGMAGVGWQLGLMPLRVADADGLVTDSSIVEAFDYAAAEGARVVNASFVSPAYSDVLREAIRRHPKVLFVAAAGNGDEDGIGDDNDRRRSTRAASTSSTSSAPRPATSPIASRASRISAARRSTWRRRD